MSLIIKDPVRWPKQMSTEFKDFLQGLLTKNPRNRLSWPALLEHPFVANGIIGTVVTGKIMTILVLWPNLLTFCFALCSTIHHIRLATLGLCNIVVPSLISLSIFVYI